MESTHIRVLEDKSLLLRTGDSDLDISWLIILPLQLIVIESEYQPRVTALDLSVVDGESKGVGDAVPLLGGVETRRPQRREMDFTVMKSCLKVFKDLIVKLWLEVSSQRLDLD